MKIKTTKRTLVELDENEVNTLYEAYNIVAELINTMRKEYAEGVTDSHYNDLYFEELKTTMMTLNCLVDMTEDDILELF